MFFNWGWLFSLDDSGITQEWEGHPSNDASFSAFPTKGHPMSVCIIGDAKNHLVKASLSGFSR